MYGHVGTVINYIRVSSPDTWSDTLISGSTHYSWQCCQILPTGQPSVLLTTQTRTILVWAHPPECRMFTGKTQSGLLTSHCPRYSPVLQLALLWMFWPALISS